MRTTKQSPIIRGLVIAAALTLVTVRMINRDRTETDEPINIQATPESEYRPVSSFYSDPKTQVLLVGTFHFDFPGLDAKKTSENDKIDVLSPARQEEMKELLDHIRRFKPTKIAIEAVPGWKATEKLRDYKAGKIELERDERYQIGIRLASELKLDTLYAIDAFALSSDLSELAPDYMKKMWKGYDWRSEGRISDQSQLAWAYSDSLRKEVSLLNFLRYLNTEDSHRMNYGLYLTGDFKLDEFRGADVLSAYWYNRNLRMFRKVQALTESPDDRIMILAGNGHAALLRQFLTYSPEYKMVEFNDL